MLIEIFTIFDILSKSFVFKVVEWFGEHIAFILLGYSARTWINPKNFDPNNYNSNGSKDFVLKVDLEYPKELG